MWHVLSLCCVWLWVYVFVFVCLCVGLHVVQRRRIVCCPEKKDCLLYFFFVLIEEGFSVILCHFSVVLFHFYCYLLVCLLLYVFFCMSSFVCLILYVFWIFFWLWFCRHCLRYLLLSFYYFNVLELRRSFGLSWLVLRFCTYVSSLATQIRIGPP